METAELDIDSAADAIVADMGLGKDAPDDLDTAIDTATPNDANLTASEGDTKAEVTTAPDLLPVPQSWKKEMHEHWGKMPKEAQSYYLEREKQMLEGLQGYKTDAEFGKSLKSVVSKYEDVLRSQGLQPQQAVDYLFNAHKQLSQGTPEQRLAYFQKLAGHYGLAIPQAGAQPEGQQTQGLPPEVKAALDRVSNIEAALAQEQTQRYEAVRQQTAKDVEAFASDPKHPYFDEVADDIAMLVKAGEKLESAYEKAVWANPVTRQKELSRIQQETEKASREKAEVAAKAAKKATSTNVKGRDTTRTPTGTRATVDRMDEVLSETLAEIKTRT